MTARALIIAKQTSKQIRDLRKFTREWPARSAAMRGYVSWLAAKFVLKEMLERIPKKDEFKPYRMGLDVVRVRGGDATDDIYAVRVDAHHRKVRKVDVQKVLIFVKSSRHLRKPKPEIEVLERNSPWTYDTIPFMPSKRDAVVITRKVDKREVVRVGKERQKNARRVRLELNRAGKRYVRKRDKLRLPKRLKNVPEVVFEALKLEFGLGSDKSRPHWRPAIQLLIRSGLRQFRRSHPELRRTLTQESFRQWQKWPPRTRRQARMSDVKLFQPFQKKLGIRVN